MPFDPPTWHLSFARICVSSTLELEIVRKILGMVREDERVKEGLKKCFETPLKIIGLHLLPGYEKYLCLKFDFETLKKFQFFSDQVCRCWDEKRKKLGLSKGVLERFYQQETPHTTIGEVKKRRRRWTTTNIGV